MHFLTVFLQHFWYETFLKFLSEYTELSEYTGISIVSESQNQKNSNFYFKTDNEPEMKLYYK